MDTKKKKLKLKIFKKHAPVFTITGWFLCLLIPLLLYSIFTAFILTRSIKVNEQLGCIAYNEIGDASYTVSYTPNEEYKEEYYPEGMKYVTGLMDTVNTKFNYEIHATSEMNYDYNYEVTGKLVINDYVDEEKILKQETTTIASVSNKSYKGSYLTINEAYKIDFNDYYLKAKKYRTNTGVSATAKLLITFKINVKTSAEGYADGKSYAREFTITVPLTESTVYISKGDSVNTNDSMCNTRAFRISNVALFITGILSIVIIFVCVILIAIELYRILTKDPYKNEVNGILKEYDRLIVSGKYDIKESNYKNIIYPTKFEEMVDASINLGEPILFYDVHPNQECHFVIIDDGTMYKFKISRKEIEYKRSEGKK